MVCMRFLLQLVILCDSVLAAVFKRRLRRVKNLRSTESQLMQARETCLVTSSAIRRRCVSRRRTYELWPTVTCTSSSVITCCKCSTFIIRSPTRSRAISRSHTTSDTACVHSTFTAASGVVERECHPHSQIVLVENSPLLWTSEN